MRLEEEKNNHESHLRSIFAYFAENFGSLFDASQKINEDSFRALVLVVKKELDKSRKQDKAVRVFFNAEDSQSTDDAMTKYIIENHPMLKSKL